VISQGSRNCYLRSEHRLVVGLGVENLVVVETDDAVLIADRSQAQAIKTVVKQLEADGSPREKRTARSTAPGATTPG
jgi:mannose-1-phosphate guanylyltransferase